MAKPDKCVVCIRCWSDNASPMIHDELWAAIGMKKEDLLCDVCFRQRLGRALRVDDLRDCPFNDEWIILAALCKRKQRNKRKQFISAAKEMLSSTDIVPYLRF
jgi:hypothetical protein